MITLIILFIIGLLKSIADTIRVPIRFNISIFKKYKGNKWIDPSAMESQNYIPRLMYPFVIHLWDLWHMINSIIIILFIVYGFNYTPIIVNLFDNIKLGYFCEIITLFTAYGIGMELGLKIIIKK